MNKIEKATVIDWSSLALTVAMGLFNRIGKLEAHTFNINVIRRASEVIKMYGMDGHPVIVGVDVGPYWRREVFPNYKIQRAKGREESAFPFQEYFAMSDKLIQSVEYMGWIVVRIKGVEADDVCAAAANYISKELLIISSDHDITQVYGIHPDKKFVQYSMKTRSVVDHNKYSIAEHILKGDRGDGVPAYTQPDDDLVIEKPKGARRPPIKRQTIELYEKMGHDQFGRVHCSATERNHLDRNRQLVSFTEIPAEVMTSIMERIDMMHKPYTFDMANDDSALDFQLSSVL